MPVNSWTMALKLEVSVVSTVVGARLDALDRFFGLRTTWARLFCSGAACCLGVFVALVFSCTDEGIDTDGVVVAKEPCCCWFEPKRDWIEDAETMLGLISDKFGLDLRAVDQDISRLRRDESGFCGGREMGSK